MWGQDNRYSVSAFCSHITQQIRLKHLMAVSWNSVQSRHDLALCAKLDTLVWKIWLEWENGIGNWLLNSWCIVQHCQSTQESRSFYWNIELSKKIFRHYTPIGNCWKLNYHPQSLLNHEKFGLEGVELTELSAVTKL